MPVIAGERYLLPFRPVRTLDRVRVRCGLLALVVVIAACGSSTAAESTSSRSTSATTTEATGSSLPCGPGTAKTVASDTVARVYETGGLIYACARGSGRRYRLGDARTCVRTERAGPVALSGTTLAYGLESCGVDTGSSSVVVRRLSDGRQLRMLPATTAQLAPESYQLVGSIVVKADGAVAWIGAAKPIFRQSGSVEVHRADRRGQAKLDSAPSIEAGSLRLRGSIVTWRHGTGTKSATLL